MNGRSAGLIIHHLPHLNWHLSRYREFWGGQNYRFLAAWVDQEFDSQYGEDGLAHSTVSSTPGTVR